MEIPIDTEFQLSSEILSLLCIPKHLTGKQYGRIDLARLKELRIYLKQINTTTNYVDTLLAFIPVADKPIGKKMLLADFKSPILKKLENGCTTELSLQITDESGTVLNNHGLLIIFELLVK